MELYEGAKISTGVRNKFAELQTNYPNGLIPQERLLNTPAYHENKAWAQHLVDNNYTVIDIGNPKNQSFSYFYSIEQQVIFGSGY